LASKKVKGMHKWYIVRVFSTQEKKVKKALEEHRELKGMSDQIVEILLPTENVSEIKRGKQHIVEKRLWPGYILIKMDFNDDSWQYVKNTNGVIDFVGGNKVIPLPDYEVDEILRDLEDKKQSVTQKHKFEVGDDVKIIEGPFINFSGKVIEVFHDKGILSVMVSIFNRTTKVELKFTSVEQDTSQGAQ
jgi:transcriptional antiterminator NusG